MRWRHLLPPPPTTTTQPSPLVLPSPQYSLLHFCSCILLLSNFSPHLALIFCHLFHPGHSLSLISPSIPSITCSLSLYPVLFQPLTHLFSLFLPFFSYRELKAACLPCCRLHTRTTKRGDRHTSPGCVRFRSALLWYRSAHQGVGVSARVLSICPLSWEGELLVKPLQNLMGVVMMVVKW